MIQRLGYWNFDDDKILLMSFVIEDIIRRFEGTAIGRSFSYIGDFEWP